MNIRGINLNRESMEIDYNLILLSAVSFLGIIFTILYLCNNLNNITDNSIKFLNFVEDKYIITKRNIWLKYMKTLGKPIEKEKKSPYLNPRKLSETFELLDITDNDINDNVNNKAVNTNEIQYEPIIIRGKNNTCIKLYAIIEEL
jgi:hypothetical protein